MTPSGLPPLIPSRAGALFHADQLRQLRQAYSQVAAIDPDQPAYVELLRTLDAMDDALLRQLADASVKFISSLALNRCIRRGC